MPTSFELGYKVALPQFRAIVVRAGTPPDIVKKLSDALAKVYASPEYKKFLEEQYADPNSFEDASKAPGLRERAARGHEEDGQRRTDVAGQRPMDQVLFRSIVPYAVGLAIASSSLSLRRYIRLRTSARPARARCVAAALRSF